jgi:hypothetical protein
VVPAEKGRPTRQALKSHAADRSLTQKAAQAGRKPIFDPAIFKERFRTIERVFAWEDKFRRLLLRFERISGLHYAFKALAYTMINLRHYCQT